MPLYNIMAKPFEVELSSSPGPSKANFLASHPSRKASEPILRRRHRPSSHPLPKASPSTTLLSLLASIASASSVYGSPAPPPFLCPTLESGEIADCPIAKRVPTQIRRAPLRVVDIKNQISARNVPDRYSQEADGAWRRVGSYTLYGSTVPACTSSTCPTSTPPVISPLDDQIQVGDSTDTLTTTSVDPSPTDLPPGWKPLTRHNRTAVILVISLILALFIGSFIVGCMFCRNRMKKSKHRLRDVEAKAQKRRRRLSNEAEIREAEVEKEIKAKQKIWAKATARWRTNARIAARQRRGRRTGSRLSQANQSTASLEDSRSCFAEPSTLPQSGDSPRSSTVSLRGDILRSDIPISSSLSSHEETSMPTEVPPLSPTRISPPAYHHHHKQIPSPVISTGDETRIELAVPSTTTCWATSSQTEHPSSYTSLSDSQPSCSTSTSLHAAHVATDDKALLARLSELASAPPEDSNEEEGLQTSAPEWHDDDLEEIIPHLTASTSEPFSFSPMFPAPPSKERLVANEFYDHSYSFEEVDPSGLASGPSAPPFEERPSSPQQDLVPSAPPLFDGEECLQEDHPSAPIWEPSSSDEQDSRADNTNEQEQELSDDAYVPSSRQDPFSGASTSSARNSILLPGYQP